MMNTTLPFTDEDQVYALIGRCHNEFNTLESQIKDSMRVFDNMSIHTFREELAHVGFMKLVMRLKQAMTKLHLLEIPDNVDLFKSIDFINRLRVSLAHSIISVYLNEQNLTCSRWVRAEGDEQPISTILFVPFSELVMYYQGITSTCEGLNKLTLPFDPYPPPLQW